MSATEFFVGDRIVDDFVIEFHGGKARLSCTVVERWEELISRPLICGGKYEREFTQRIGITSIDREEMEATISGSLGLKGIAEFKSAIKGKTGRELQLEQAQETKETTKFTAPKCGRLILLIYQLKRLYQFSYQDTRFLHKDSWTKPPISQWIDRIHDASKRSENDPACGCDPKVVTGIDGLLYLALGKISMLAGYKDNGHGIEIPSLNLSIPANEDQTLPSAVSIDRKAIPQHLVFLANEQADNLEGKLLPYIEEWSTDVDQENIELYGDLQGVKSSRILVQQRRLTDELHRRIWEAEQWRRRQLTDRLKIKDPA